MHARNDSGNHVCSREQPERRRLRCELVVPAAIASDEAHCVHWCASTKHTDGTFTIRRGCARFRQGDRTTQTDLRFTHTSQPSQHNSGPRRLGQRAASGPSNCRSLPSRGPPPFNCTAAARSATKTRSAPPRASGRRLSQSARTGSTLRCRRSVRESPTCLS